MFQEELVARSTSPVLQCPTAACGFSVLYLWIHQDLLTCRPEGQTHKLTGCSPHYF